MGKEGKEIISYNPPINPKDLRFYHAIDNNMINVLSKMIYWGFNVNSVDDLLDSPLNRAISSNAIDSIKFLINAGADLYLGEKCSPLGCAFLKGSMDAVRILLDSGADIYHKDSSGKTSLHYAAASNDKIKMDFIIPYFKDNIDIIDNNGSTAIIDAAESDADKNIKILYENGANLDVANANGNTAVMLAALWRNEKSVRVLLELGANPLLIVEDKFTELPMMSAKVWETIVPYFREIEKGDVFSFTRRINNRRYFNIILQMLLHLRLQKKTLYGDRLLSFLGEGKEEKDHFLVFFNQLTQQERLNEIINLLNKFPEYQDIEKEDTQRLDNILQDEEDNYIDHIFQNFIGDQSAHPFFRQNEKKRQ